MKAIAADPDFAEVVSIITLAIDRKLVFWPRTARNTRGLYMLA